LNWKRHWLATRCGDLDPGVVLHLIRDHGMDPQDVADMLYQRSGLLEMSGISGDTRVPVEREAPEAEEALAVYCYRIACEAGSLAVAMEGIDAVAFSGGVGENSAKIRAQIARHLKWLGVQLDEAANRDNASLLSPRDAAIPVACITADEERIIARDFAALLWRTRKPQAG
jgi:acetate kinase